MKNIALIITGGTILCHETSKGLSPCESMIDKVLSLLPCDIIENVTIKTIPLMLKDSTNIDASDMLAIAKEVNEKVTAIDGIVILHGTDTMAYTSAMLDNAFENLPIPVVITGSQRPSFANDSDAKRNITSAFNTACSDDIKGVFIAFGDYLIKGKYAHKIDSICNNAFISINGYTAKVNDCGALYDIAKATAIGEYRFSPNIINNAKNTAIFITTPYSTIEQLSSVITTSTKKLIIVAYGMGGIPQWLYPALENAIANGVKVVMISQCLYGGTNTDVYEVGQSAKQTGVVDIGLCTVENALFL